MSNLSYGSPKTVVKESQIHGRGLFAREPIAQGEMVALQGGYILNAATLGEVEPALGPAQITMAEGLFIGPLAQTEREGAMLFSNHSCDPNIGVQGQIVVVALRDIQPGEELTHDWATTDDDTYEMPCTCGARHCRGIITGQDWRRKDLQQKDHGDIACYLQRTIDMGECSPVRITPKLPGCLTRVRGLVVEEQPTPESGCSRVLPLCRSRRRRHPVSSRDVMSVHRCQADMAAPQTYEASVAIVVADASAGSAPVPGCPRQRDRARSRLPHRS
jgi:uncharacterized protein